ncbi:MAG: WhiB family transcriptional regulator [Acidimicrobiia bacterium]|nr:WhiB family transcriptional regulator [Microthrixaceae bacterium]MCB9376880.1 WhiB family transcriptional regulator [Microthrixaceae bacterium]MCB9402651.1 WhiB family transcriptional regulator [Microthrixaceae bacterium]MCC6184861.1 WhiB family transcriptional regulator [Microthrixaceae bacterium]RTL04727.1 MAG: WhiB family transcriptional regulator [Acidimicrobiia bacterium]
MAHGNCADQPPSLFFPSDGVGVEVAKRICADCPMRVRCLDYALDNRIDHGVWGGTSERERRRILKARQVRQPAGVG